MTMIMLNGHLLGPFSDVKVAEDRISADTTDFLFSVVGDTYSVIAQDPPGRPEDWLWSGTAYVARPVSPEVLAAARDLALSDLASQRWEATQFFTYDGVRTHANNAIGVISARLQLRRETGVPDDYPMKFKLSDGEFRSWDRAGEVEFGQALADHVQGCFDLEGDLTEQIAAAETPSAIGDIVEAARAGWPA